MDISNVHTHTHTHTHTHNIYIYIYIVCVCVNMCVSEGVVEKLNFDSRRKNE